MSGIAWVDLPSGARCLYRRYALLARRYGVAFATQPFIARNMGVSLATIRRHTAALKKAGLITIERRPRRSNLVRIAALPEMATAPTTDLITAITEVEEKKPEGRNGGVAPRRGTIMATRPTTDADRIKAAEAAAKRRTSETAARAESLQALEVTFGEAVRARTPGRLVEPFTGRAKGQARDLRERYGAPGAKALITHGVKRWGMLRRSPTLKWLPEAPTWGALYAAREEIAADMAQAEREAQRKVTPMPVRELVEQVVEATTEKRALRDYLPDGRVKRLLEGGSGEPTVDEEARRVELRRQAEALRKGAA